VSLAVALFAQTRVKQDFKQGQKNELPSFIVVFKNFWVKFTNALNLFQYSVKQTNILTKLLDPDAIVLRSFIFVVDSGIDFNSIGNELHYFFLIT
jgi:hypothetical protein